ncbi:MAG: hypothetical protein GX923_02030 [Clostridia bacterium]|nr:hypothetical protein [Clostridia bacterium]
MKKQAILFLMFALLVTSTAVYANSEEANALQVIDLEGYTIYVLEKTANYEKLKSVNKKTGEVEYVESFLGGEQPKYVVTTEESELLVTKDEDEILIYEDNVIIQRIGIGPIVSISGIPTNIITLLPWLSTSIGQMDVILMLIL